MQMRRSFRILAATLLLSAHAMAGPLDSPPGLVKDLDDTILGQAIVVQGKQLFIDDYVIDEMRGTTKSLHQPVKHAGNPLLVRDRPWEESGPGYGTVLFDAEERLFKMWYQFWQKTEGTSTGQLCYAVSRDGITWEKPAIGEGGSNMVLQPPVQGFQCAGVFKDPVENDSSRRYKLLFSANPDGTNASWLSSAAWSADGIHWEASKELPLIPFSDTQLCPFWDHRRGRYTAFLRYGPPNTRIISCIESEDFLSWSPKLTVLRPTRLDGPLATQFYQMTPLPYEGIYLGLVCAYHNETLKQPPPDEPWTDRKNLHLAFSRNGVTWTRVGRQGAFAAAALQEERDWRREALDAAFLPYGEKDVSWDWGTIHPYFMPAPMIVDDQIRFYYLGQNGRNWWNYQGDPPALNPQATPPDTAVGLATLRLDGFVSIDAETEGTMTTRPLVFLGDTIEVNVDAAGGRLVVEALDESGRAIDGFAKDDCDPIGDDALRRAVSWKGSDDCHLLQGRPIRLRFHLQRCKLYAFEPRVRRNHYVPSYD